MGMDNPSAQQEKKTEQEETDGGKLYTKAFHS
jgi:hypothetical protein